MLDIEEHLEQNLLSAGATEVDGENNHLKMLRYWAVVMISTSCQDVNFHKSLGMMWRS